MTQENKAQLEWRFLFFCRKTFLCVRVIMFSIGNDINIELLHFGIGKEKYLSA